MLTRLIRSCSAVLFAFAVTASSPALTLAASDGVVRVKSAYWTSGNASERAAVVTADARS